MKKEIVFEIWGKDGGIRILRGYNPDTEKQIFLLGEFDNEHPVFDDSMKREYSDFESLFMIIHKKYTWFMLNLLVVHDDYREYVLKKLLDKLNKFNTPPEQLKDTQGDLEKALGVRLINGFLPLNNGIQKIQITNLVQLRDYEYQEDKIKGTYEIAINPTQLENLENEYHINVNGKLEASGNVFIIRDINNNIRYAFPADKFLVSAEPLKSRTKGWYYEY